MVCVNIMIIVEVNGYCLLDIVYYIVIVVYLRVCGGFRFYFYYLGSFDLGVGRGI